MTLLYLWVLKPKINFSVFYIYVAVLFLGSQHKLYNNKELKNYCYLRTSSQASRAIFTALYITDTASLWLRP